ncbi:MAG TPA: hypothetical protein PKN96_01890 [Flavobacterium sp.]|uniref:hypothetical protein n=1 Tax=Flavobacterium sp. TaxID=239 RepID=UPI002C2C1C49|nr:hypothetical protein [Flavobacterium sp.]HNP32024.1 hypothetical protein [Flavobacterium sp.]
MKKNNFKILALIFISALSLSSCSSDGSGDSTGTTTGNYLPLAVGNKWNYTDGTTATLDQITGTTNFGGTTYYDSDSNYDPGIDIQAQSWQVKKGASYYQKTGEATYVEGSTTIVMDSYEMKTFRDDLAVGETWTGSASPKVHYSSSSGSGTLTAHVNYTGKITARDVSETLEGVTYNNVIKMQMDVVETVNSQVTNIHGEYWLAKDIGIIRESILSSTDNITRTRNLTSYELH